MDWEKTIFLAHASEDKPLVRQLYQKLKDHGLQPWLDEKVLTPGVEWDTEIREAIKKSRFFLACFSKHGVRKDGYIQRELRIALSLMEEKAPGTVYMIPGLLDDTELPSITVGTISLKNYQYVRLYDPDGLQWLVHTLKSQMGIDENSRASEARKELEAIDRIGPLILRKFDQFRTEQAALNQLGMNCYKRGEYEEAAKHFERALVVGGPQASILLNLAILYEDGLGVNQNYTKAFDLLNQASSLGDATAKTRLGVLYQNGYGTPQDITAAISCFREAADKGDGEGLALLAIAYLAGEGVDQDTARGIDLMIKAAEVGNAEAQSTLSVIYSNGLHVEQDLQEAMKWATLAASQGDLDAISDLKNLVDEIHKRFEDQ